MTTKIMLVGEAWGEKEEEAGRPFVGPSGWFLDQLLSQAGIDRRDCAVSNVFNLRPKPSNDIKNLCGTAKQGIKGLPPLAKGKYLLPQYASELERLYEDVKREQPNAIVALGATAAWAFLHSVGIRAVRGAVAETAPLVTQRLARTFKVLPTYHPAAVMRDYSLCPVVVADLDKAKRESEFPDVRRPRREIWIEPDLDDLRRYEQDFILPARALAADIETAGDQITCIGFSPRPDSALVIPFFSETASGRNYWRTREEELIAWDYVKRWLSMKPTIFQNGMYDIQFLWRSYGIAVPLAEEDTMLMHHAFQPEMEKGLGFLATIYTDEASWKFMRKGTMAHD